MATGIQKIDPREDVTPYCSPKTSVHPARSYLRSPPKSRCGQRRYSRLPHPRRHPCPPARGEGDDPGKHLFSLMLFCLVHRHARQLHDVSLVAVRLGRLQASRSVQQLYWTLKARQEATHIDTFLLEAHLALEILVVRAPRLGHPATHACLELIHALVEHQQGLVRPLRLYLHRLTQKYVSSSLSGASPMSLTKRPRLN